MLITILGVGLAILSIGSFSAIYATNKKLSKTFVGRYSVTDLPLSGPMLKASHIKVSEIHRTNPNHTSHNTFNSAYDAFIHVSSRLQQMNLLYVDVYKLDDGTYYIENPKLQLIDKHYIKSTIIIVPVNKM